MTADRSWDIGLAVLSVYDGSGFLGIQYDAEGSELGGLSSGADATPVPAGGGVHDYEAIHPGGIMHRPMDPATDANGNPVAAQAAQVLNFREGGHTFALCLGDPRTQAILPTIAPGSTIVFSDCGSFLRLEGSGPAQGQISLFTTDDGTPTGYSVGFQVFPTGITEFTAGGGRRTFDATGYEIVDASGARLQLGFTGGMPGPLASLEAGFAVLADTATLDAALVSLGRASARGRSPAVRATELQAQVISVLVQAVANLQKMVLALASTPAATGAPPAGAAPLIPTVTGDVAPVAALATSSPASTWISSTVFVS